MGALNKFVGKKHDSVDSLNDMDYQYEIPIDDPSQEALHKEMLMSFTS